MNPIILEAQHTVLQAVVASKVQVYLVAGTALAMRYQHRYSEDLDFFTQTWTKTLHRTAAKQITARTRFPVALAQEMTKPGRAKVAVYQVQVTARAVLKIDIVEDVDPLLHPVAADGIASTDDLYLRKIRAAIGWRGQQSNTGRALAGGRQEAKDLFDLWYLSEHYIPLHVWFPQQFSRQDYVRLVHWLQTMTGQTTTMALLDIAPACDTRRIMQHMEDQIYERLNQHYAA